MKRRAGLGELPHSLPRKRMVDDRNPAAHISVEASDQPSTEQAVTPLQIRSHFVDIQSVTLSFTSDDDEYQSFNLNNFRIQSGSGLIRRNSFPPMACESGCELTE